MSLANVTTLAEKLLHRDDLGDLIGTALALGHRELQKAFDWSVQDAGTANFVFTPGTSDAGGAALPEDFKKPRAVWFVDAVTGARKKEIMASNLAEVDALERKIVGLHDGGRGFTREPRWYLKGGRLYLWPRLDSFQQPTPETLAVDYWKFLAFPADAGQSDFFTENGRLCLAYWGAWLGSTNLWDDERAGMFEQKAAVEAARLKKFDEDTTLGPTKAYRPPMQARNGRRI